MLLQVRLEKLAETLMTNEDDESQDYLMEVYDRLDELGADTAEAKASNILKGLGFDTAMQQKQCKEFSGQYVIYSSSSARVISNVHILKLWRL